LKIWILFLGFVAPIAFGQDIRLGPAEIGQECSIRSYIVARAIEGHNSRTPKKQTIAFIKNSQVGAFLNYPAADKYIANIVERVYTGVPTTDGFPISSTFNQMCLNDPEQYIGTVTIVNWDALPR